MGFGLPAAIGAKVAAPNKIVVDIDGDASFSMTAMELATASQYGIGVKVLVMNNEFQGMVVQWQGRLSGYFDPSRLNPEWFTRSLLRTTILSHPYDQPRLCQARKRDGCPCYAMYPRGRFG